MTENTAAKRPKKIMFLMPKDTSKIVCFFSKKWVFMAVFMRLVFMQATATGILLFGRDAKQKH